MTEPVTTAAPATAPTTTTEAKPTENQAVVVKRPDTQAKPAEATWTDEHSKQFESLLKLKGSKLKMKHEETPINSIDDFHKALQLAQRGLGGAKQAEEFRKKEESYQAKLKASEEREALIEAARSGDYDARKALGLVSKQEEKARQAELEEVPPEVRALLEERNEYARKLHEYETRAQKEKLEVQQRQQQAAFAEAKEIALTETNSILQDMGFSPETAESHLRYTYAAIAELAEAGLVIGEDMTPELIKQRVRQMRDEASETAYKQLKPENRLKHVMPELESASDEALAKMIPEKLQERFARLYAKRLRAAKAQPEKQVTLAKDTKPERATEVPRVLTFGGPRYQR